MAPSTTASAGALAFHKTTFTIIHRDDGQVWLRYQEIADALGYSKHRTLHELYFANAAEFTDSMTAVVKLRTAGGLQDVRLFSLRGAWLLGMFSRTERAAEFRRWVLDVLDRQAQAAAAAALPTQAAPTDALRAQNERLRQALLTQHPDWARVQRYHQMQGLTQRERAKLMGWTVDHYRLTLKRMAALELVDYAPKSQAQVRAQVGALQRAKRQARDDHRVHQQQAQLGLEGGAA